MGNLFIRREGNNGKAPVLMGSHLDTQPCGGRFDGVLGVLSALEVLRVLEENNIKTEHPLEVVVWTNEEGARFSPAMMGSGVFSGVFKQSEIFLQEDNNGVSVEQALHHSDQLGSVACKSFPIKAYYELHIEQGPVLELENKTIGVVTGAQGISWNHVTLNGQTAHAGTTPMNYRKDPVFGMAQIVRGLQKIIKEQKDSLYTVGRVESKPDSINSVANTVFFTVDLRHSEDAILKIMQQKFKNLIDEVCVEQNLTSELNNIWHSPAISFNENCILKVKIATEKLGYSYQNIVSGAGHDACQISYVAPVGMIFIPCKGGLSHNEAESISPENAQAGANVLLNAVLESSVIN
jgi:N-carbamoyl-L-amino-acid hydrolase